MHRIGIDIGGTQLRIAILDEDYKIIEVYKTLNEKTRGAEDNCAPLVDWIRGKQQEGYEFAGIGIGSPGPLDLRTGKILNPPNLVGWDNFEIVRYFADATGLPTFLNNDANVAGLSEALLGGGKGFESVIFVGLSTGFGGAFVYQGKLINGAHCNTAEYWNSIVCDDPNGRGSANPGSLNENAGGTGIARVATVRYGRPMDPKELFDRYYAGEQTALEVFDYCTEILARGLANIYWNFDPDVVVVGGSIDTYHPIYLETALKKAVRYLPAPDSLHIEKARFGDDAGLVGAALLVG